VNKTLVFGHKSPDTDSVTSAIVMAEFEKKLGNEAKACVLGKLNKETTYVFNYLGIDEPEYIDKVEDGQKIILVDHNEEKQSVENRNNAIILKVVDHHAIDFKVGYPISYISEPVGCTATLLYKMYKQNGFEIDKKLAVLMLSAIISDTLLFKSPTCTNEDKIAADELNKIANIDIQNYGLEMLKAGTDLSDLSAKELISLDAKEFSIGNIKTVVAQVNTASISDMLQRKSEIEEEIKKEIEKNQIDLFMFVITDIIESNSQTITLGKESNLVEKSYNVKLEENTAFLPGVVSRKKQIIPVLTENA
jgi:manganese-dependent inorganic pyrophosphatase